jgi:hypothetical protein
LLSLNEKRVEFKDYQMGLYQPERFFTVESKETLTIFKLQLMGNFLAMQEEFPRISEELFHSQLKQLERLLERKMRVMQSMLMKSIIGPPLVPFGLNRKIART